MAIPRRKRGLRPDPLDALTGAVSSVVPAIGGVAALVYLKDFVVEAAIGDADTASATAPRVVLVVPFDGIITKVELILGKNQTCGATSLVVDVHKILDASKSSDGQGTTLYTTQANRPTVSSGNRYSSAALPDVRTVDEGDVLAFYIDTAGTGVTSCTIAVSGERT